MKKKCQYTKNFTHAPSARLQFLIGQDIPVQFVEIAMTKPVTIAGKSRTSSTSQSVLGLGLRSPKFYR